MMYNGYKFDREAKILNHSSFGNRTLFCYFYDLIMLTFTDSGIGQSCQNANDCENVPILKCTGVGGGEKECLCNESRGWIQVGTECQCNPNGDLNNPQCVDD